MINNKVIVSDFSFWQDDDYTPYKIDFSIAYRAGLDGTILRAGQNVWADEDFLDYCKNADDAGLPRGAYWFFDSRVSPIPQADLFADLIKRAGNFPPLGLWGDYEENYGGAYGGEKHFKIFMDRLQEKFPGKLIGVYTGPDYWRTHTSLLGRLYFQKFPLWIANYKVSQPSIPGPWRADEWILWQYTAEGDGRTFGAESEEVDLNYFNGNLEKYKTYFNIPDYEPALPPEEGEGMKIYRVKSTTLPHANLRDAPEGNDIGNLYPGQEFTVDTTALDDDGELWLHCVAPAGYVIDYLCEFVRNVEEPTPGETHLLEVYVDGVLKYQEEF
jgi:lysozyme